jgi:hypothetical protein
MLLMLTGFVIKREEKLLFSSLFEFQFAGNKMRIILLRLQELYASFYF